MSVVATGGGTAQTSSTAATVTYTVDLLPGQEDEIELTISLSVDEGAANSLGEASWDSSPADGEHVVDSSGISAGISEFQWDGQTTDAHVTIRYPPSGIGEVSDSFAIVEVNSAYGNSDIVSEEVSNGVRGSDYILFGDHTLLSDTVAGQELRLAVPDALVEDVPPSQIYDLLSFSAEHLETGSPHDRVTGFGTLEISPQAAGTKFFTRFNTSTRETWAHEYHHTQQAYNPSRKMAWLLEAEAEWASYLVGYKAGLVDWEEIWNDIGHDEVGQNVRLVDWDTWETNSNYEKGALVIADLDERIRNGTNGSRTYWDVTRQLNELDASGTGQITVETFTQALSDVIGHSMQNVVDAYVKDTNVPYEPHRETIEQNSTGVHAGNVRRGFEIVNLEYPEEFAQAGSPPVDVTVENTGFEASTETIRLGTAEDERKIDPQWVHDTQEVSLDPDAQTTVSLSGPEQSESKPAIYDFRVTTGHNWAGGRIALGDLSILGEITAPDQIDVGNPIDIEVSVYDPYDEISVTRSVELVDDADGSVVDSVDLQMDQFDGETVTVTRPGSQNSNDGVFNYVVRTADESKSGSVTIGEGTNISCFITTATANDVSTLNSLRRFRDESMSATPLGRALVWLYYRISPPIADTLERNPDSRTANATRSLVLRCADISDRQEATDSRMRSAALGVQLTLLYIVGIFTGAIGHGAIRASELTDD